jgi:hypothetical protein
MNESQTTLRRPISLAIAAAVSIGNLFLHKPISDICDAIFARIGRAWYERTSIAAIALLSLIAAWPFARSQLRALYVTSVIASVLVLAFLTVAAQQLLLVSNIELIHFPQFALIAALLLASGIGPSGAWLGATFAGLLDESYQHLILYKDVPNTYFDYNDIFLNAIGAAWGTILFGATRLRTEIPAPARSPLALTAAGLGVAGLAALWLDPPLLSPFLSRAATGSYYRVMSMPEGLLGVALVAVLVRFARREPSR